MTSRRRIFTVLRWLFMAAILVAILAPDLAPESWAPSWGQSFGLFPWDALFLWAFLFALVAGMQLDLEKIKDALARSEASLRELVENNRRKNNGQSDELR